MADLDPLREALIAARRDGRRFADAWPQARARLNRTLPPRERRSWSLALDATRPAWERAYEQRGQRLQLSRDTAT